MRKKIILLALALIAGIVLFSFSLLIAKEIEKNKRQEKRIVEFVNQKKSSNVLENKQLKKINQNININKQVKTIIDEVDVSDWNIYRNEEYGYLIKYPKDWDVREFPNTRTGTYFIKGNNKIAIDSMGAGKTYFDEQFDEYVKHAAVAEIQNYEFLNSIEEVITNSGIKGYRTTWNISRGSSPNIISSEIVYFEAKKQGFYKNRKTIQIGHYSHHSLRTDEYYKIFNTMIKTFDYIK